MRLLVLISLLFTFNAWAEEQPGFTVYPHFGITLMDDSIDDDNHWGLGVGYRFDNPWGIELTYKNTDTELDNLPGDVDVDLWNLDGLYHMNSGSKLNPFVSVGIGRAAYDITSMNDASEQLATVGVGFKYFMGEKAALRGDAKLWHGKDDNLIDSTVSLGLHIALGGSSAPAPAPAAPVEKDSDRDGVLDSADNCPGTPYGVEVNSKGCPLDDDGDGVPNYKDNCPDTTDRAARIDSDGCYMKLERKVSVTLNVEFDFDSSKSRPEHKAEVRKVADFMKSFPSTSVVMEGHTDSKGAEAYNQRLSERRAKTIADMLVTDFGIDGSRVDSRGYGESRPVASNDTDEGRQHNRRVVAHIEEQEEEIEMK